MNIKNVAIHSIISTLYKTLSSLIIIKILATKIGVDGLGEISNAFSLIGFITVFCILGVGAGITKYVAMSKTKSELYSIIRVSIYTNLIITLALILCSILYSNKISIILFTSAKYEDLLILLAILTLPLGLTVISLSVINGMRRTELISKFQLTGLVGGSIIMYIMVSNFGLRGGVIGLYMIPSVPIIYVIYLCRKEFLNTLWLFQCEKNDFKLIKKLIKYSAITLLSIFLSNMVQLFYRADLNTSFGVEAVGHWQALLRISDGYSQIFLVFLMGYLLPNIARENKSIQRAKFVNGSIAPISLFMVIIFSLIYIMREIVVNVALTSEFGVIVDYFKLQLLSDFFRVMSYIPGILVLVYGSVKLSAIMEVIQASLLILIGKLLISDYGLYGAVWSYLISYVTYFIIVYASYLIYFKKLIKNEKEN